MTLIVGIRCSDSVVIGTDSAATFTSSSHNLTISQPFHHKIDIIDESIIVAGTGAIGLGQRFIEIVRDHWTNKKLRDKTEIEIGPILAREAINNFRSTGIDPLDSQQASLISYGALVAIPHKRKPTLIEFPPDGLQPEVKTTDLWYASMGSGQVVADPLLGFVRATFWENNSPPNRQGGIFAATMVLMLGCQMAPFGVSEPIQMAVLEVKGKELTARQLSSDELLEQKQSVVEALKHFREYREKLGGQLPPATPPPEPN